jgi:lysozyme family protein
MISLGSEEDKMEITQQQREEIYLEERSKRKNVSGHAVEMLLVFNVFAAAVLAGIYIAAKTPARSKITIENIRRAYSGLSPDEM